MLPPQVISSVLPSPNLTHIVAGDLENDILIILNWINLLPLPISAPTPRIRSAIKSALKDSQSQVEFTRLLNNSINEIFPKNFDFNGSIENTMLSIISTKQYYDDLLVQLNLNTNSTCRILYHRNINKMFKLLVMEKGILGQLHEYFDDHLLLLNTTGLLPIFQFFNSIEMNRQVYQMIIHVTIRKIKVYIIDRFSLKWDKPVLPTLTKFIQLIYPNINLLLTNLDLAIELNDLIRISYNELISLRINEIYKVVINYPNTHVALVELNKCLTYDVVNPDDNIEFYQRNRLVENFSENVQLNLLNSGINTINLIKTYIKIIKSFLIIDHKGVLLDRVIRPIRRYLKTRDDIINKLVLGLLDKEPELKDLSKELQDTERSFKLVKNFDELNDLNWVPDPIDALPDFKKFKINDIIQSLISIFDSKEIFITEFTKLFGNKLINNQENLSSILNLINLLKLRFGKNEFFNLDIMVKDFINSRSNKEQINDTTLRCLILSHLYWTDILESANFKLHPNLEDIFHKYCNEVYKPANFNRFLRVIPNFGTIKLNVQSRPYEVSLDKASVIMMFEGENDGVSIPSICETLQMSEYQASKCLEFWEKENVIVKITSQLYIENDE